MEMLASNPRPARRVGALAGAALLLAALAACEGSPLAPDPGAARAEAAGSPPPAAISVLTWNMYVGTDVDAVLAALQSDNPSDVPAAIQAALTTLLQTDVSARAAAIADQVARHRPHVLGFEEVSEVHVHLGMPGVPDVDLDYVPILRQALADRGLDYELVAVGPGLDVSLAAGAVSLSDHDILLVDADRVDVLGSEDHAFTYNIGDALPGVSLRRGWVQARVEVDGTEYTIVDTHPESDQGAVSFDELRAAQLSELTASVVPFERVVLMGDLNGRPGSAMYGVLEAAGFTDAWRALRPGAEGYTCCHLPDLSDLTGELDHRIDYIFTRGLGRSGPDLQGAIDRLGDVPADRVQGPSYEMWPSDHAGLVARFLSTPAAGE